MIKLTRLNGQPFYLNAFLIESFQENPDTTIFLTNGKIFIVKEKTDELAESIHEYFQKFSVLQIVDNKKAGDYGEK